MLSWLAKKGENARVHMCTKEVLWDLEKMSGPIRARVRINTALWLRHLAHSGLDLSAVHDPLNVPRAVLVEKYNLLEDMRNEGKLQNEHVERQRRRLGMPAVPPEEDEGHVMLRSIEMLMISLGAGIVPDRRDDVLAAWRLLASISVLDVGMATQRLLLVEKMGETLGSPGGAWGARLTGDELAELAGFLPDFIARSL